MRIIAIFMGALFITGPRAGQAASALRGANQETKVQNPLTEKVQLKSPNLRGRGYVDKYTRMLPYTLEETTDDFVKQIKNDDDFRKWIFSNQVGYTYTPLKRLIETSMTKIMQMIKESKNKIIKKDETKVKLREYTQTAENAKLIEQINKSIKQTVEKFNEILDSIRPDELDSYDNESQVISAWNGEDIFISKSYLLLFKDMIVSIQEMLSNDFKFDKDVENLVIDITKKLVEARKNEKGEFRLLTHPNQEFDIQIKHLGKIIMEIIF